MSERLVKAAETVSLFCRLNINIKKALPIRSSEMGLLIFICKNENPITPVMAADFFKVKKPMITTTGSNLLRHGYIEKIPSPEDKRSHFLNPTKKARQLVEDTFTEYLKTMELIRHELGDKDFGNLITLIKKVNTVFLEEKSHG